LLARIEGLDDQANDRCISFDMQAVELKSLLENNRHLPFTERLLGLGLSDVNLLIMQRFCYQVVHYVNDIIHFDALPAYWKNGYEWRQVRCAFLDGSHELVKRKLIEQVEQNEREPWEEDEGPLFKMTKKAKNEFFAELPIPMEPKLKTKKKKSDNDAEGLIRYQKLKPKKLFYNPLEQTQIDRIWSLLEGDKYKKAQERLAAKGFRTGFACLFSGGPGTGKTEAVYQLARRNQRNIMKINASDILGSFVGESEKSIKAVFDEYRKRVNRSRVAPILFLNEADGLLTKRASKDAANPSVVQMWNTMQNIILEEMENLNGIMIATTNLAANLDKAFDRRFLFKVEFSKPDMASRQSIWRSLVSELSEAEASELASRVEFPGGQIENVARKCIIENALNETELSLDGLISFCGEEGGQGRPVGRIGFGF
jgi:hypothetical protein